MLAALGLMMAAAAVAVGAVPAGRSASADHLPVDAMRLTITAPADYLHNVPFHVAGDLKPFLGPLGTPPPPVSDIGVPDQPVEIYLDGKRHAQATTGQNGRFTVSLTLARPGRHTIHAVALTGEVVSNVLVIDLRHFPLAIAVAPHGAAGGVTATWDGMRGACPPACAHSVGDAASVSVAANPVAGWRFRGWTGACSGPTPTCSFTMSGARSLTASFEEVIAPPKSRLTVQVVDGAGGVIRAPGHECRSVCHWEFDRGERVELSSDPAPNSRFTGWTGACSSRRSACVVTLDAHKSVAGTFAADPGFVVLGVELTGDGERGTVRSEPSGITCGSRCETLFRKGTSVRLVADGTRAQVRWPSSCRTTDGACVVTLDDDTTVRVSFVRVRRPEPPNPPTDPEVGDEPDECAQLCGPPTAGEFLGALGSIVDELFGGATGDGSEGGKPKPDSPASRMLGALVLLALVGFPAVLFDKTLEENQVHVRSWWRQRGPKFLSFPVTEGRINPGVAAGLFCAVAGTLTFVAQREWHKGPAGLIGWTGAVVLTIVGFELPQYLFARYYRLAGMARAVAGGLVVATVCALASFAFSINPPYVYGVVVGFEIARRTRAQAGRAAMFSAGGAAAMGAVALVLWTISAEWARGRGASFAAEAVGTMTSGTMIACIEAIAFGFVPLRFLEGWHVFRWSRWRWATIQLTGALAFGWMLAASPTGKSHFDRVEAGSIETFFLVAPFVLFAAGSLVFWNYFRLRPSVETVDDAAPSHPTGDVVRGAPTQAGPTRPRQARPLRARPRSAPTSRQAHSSAGRHRNGARSRRSG